MWCDVVRRYFLLGLVGGSLLFTACGGSGDTQAGPNDRAACQALNLLYASNGANPISAAQAQTWGTTYGQQTENRQLRFATFLLVAAGNAGNQARVLNELAVAAEVCTTMGIGPGPGIIPNTGT
jgi:hypothetical protein